MPRAVVATSGGVDSAVAAALLQAEGFEVVAAWLRLHEHGDAGAARQVAEALGVPLEVLDLRARFERRVVAPFVGDYLAGRTPNPCVVCNPRVKLAALLDLADARGAEVVATGHYARVGRRPPRLLRATDPGRDQSYFLHRLGREVLDRLRLPVGELSKDRVRQEAARRGLPVAEAAASREICFVPPGRHAQYVAARAGPGGVRPGRLLGPGGQVLGRHDGVHRFTVGQRRGLGVAAGERLFVRTIDASSGDVVLGRAADLEVPGLRTAPCRWVAGDPPCDDRPLTVRIRHRHRGVGCTLTPLAGGGAEMRFARPIAAVAPGQAAVLYSGDEVLGGGTIREALEA